MKTDKKIEEILEKYDIGGVIRDGGIIKRGLGKEDLKQELTNLLTQQREEAEQRGFNKAWVVVKKLMSFGSPEEAETYLQNLDKGDGE